MLKRIVQATLGLGTALGLLTLASYVPMAKAQVVPEGATGSSIISSLTASRLVVTDSSGGLASNGALTSGTVPVATGTGTLGNSGIADGGGFTTITNDVIQAMVNAGGDFRIATPVNNSGLFIFYDTELLTLNTGGTTTDTTMTIPAGALILGVQTRVTTTITTAVSFSVGDPTTTARFSASAGGMVAGSTRNGMNQWSGAAVTLATGPLQDPGAATAVRITTNANPGAGVIRIRVWYLGFTAIFS